MMWKKKEHRKIVVFSAILLCIFGLFSAWYVNNVRTIMKTETEEDMRFLLEQEAKNILSNLDNNFNPYGRLAGSADRQAAGEDALSARGGGYQISAPYPDPVSKKMVVAFSISAAGENDDARPAVFVAEVETLERELLHDFYGGNGICNVIDQNGDLILTVENDHRDKRFHNLYDKIMETCADRGAAERAVNQIKADLREGRSGFVECELDKVDRYIGYTNIGGAAKRWNLVCIAETGKADEHSGGIFHQTVLLCALAMLLMVFMIAYNVRVQSKSNKKLEKLAYYDALTQIYNVNYFQMKASAMIAQNNALAYAIICVDIKNFKYINKTYGYRVGDQIIRDMAGALHENFSKDEVCARLANDQFVILYAMEEYPKLLRYYAVLEEFIHRQNFGPVNISLAFTTGVYEVEDRGENIMEMIDKAKLAAKSAKTNPLLHCAFYDDALLQSFIREQEIENLMHAAFAKHEFLVYLQPKYEFKTKKFTGAEALVRWRSEKNGFMRPDEFIPVFEKTGFIVELDFYMLEEALKKVRGWLDKGVEPAVVSVNQSRIHMDNPLYVERLEALMKRYNMPPGLIELELTESMFLDDDKKLIAILERMHEIGFSISMDDFGSGYSSLNLLKEIPVDVLKLDKVFLEETANSERSRIIVEQVAQMARALGMRIVCEGVETQRQVEFLQKIGCDLAQGYFYAKPMPIEEFDDFCRTANACAN